MKEALLEYLNTKSRLVDEHIFSHADAIAALPCLSKGAYSYVRRGGKRLRPAVLSLSAGLLGGEEKEKAALPAAAAVELFHTWTLIHDDIIDRDELRRGGPSVHIEAAQDISASLPNLSVDVSREYGEDVAILSGDLLHARAISLLTHLSENGVSPAVVITLIDMLETDCLGPLLDGEMEDTAMGLIKDCSEESLLSLSYEDVLRIEGNKTSALFAYCTSAGGMIGLDTADKSHPSVRALFDFAYRCGLAFQLKDDILGIIGDEKKLGKPIGSDIREGKKSIPLLHAFREATPAERACLFAVCGNRYADEDAVKGATKIICDRGGIEKASEMAAAFLENARAVLSPLPDNRYKSLLLAWADSMVARTM